MLLSGILRATYGELENLCVFCLFGSVCVCGYNTIVYVALSLC